MHSWMLCVNLPLFGSKLRKPFINIQTYIHAYIHTCNIRQIMHVTVSACLSTRLTVSLSVWVSVYQSICIFLATASIFLFICLSIYLLIFLTIYLSNCRSPLPYPLVLSLQRGHSPADYTFLISKPGCLDTITVFLFFFFITFAAD